MFIPEDVVESILASLATGGSTSEAGGRKAEKTITSNAGRIAPRDTFSGNKGTVSGWVWLLFAVMCVILCIGFLTCVHHYQQAKAKRKNENAAAAAAASQNTPGRAWLNHRERESSGSAAATQTSDMSAMELQWYGRYSARVRENLQRGKPESRHRSHAPQSSSATETPAHLVSGPMEPREAVVLPPYTPLEHGTPLPPYEPYESFERR